MENLEQVQHVGADNGEMDFLMEVLIASMSSNLLSLIIGFMLIWLALRGLDKLSGIDFKKKVGELDGTALSIYLGARIIAFAIFVGLGVS